MAAVVYGVLFFGTLGTLMSGPAQEYWAAKKTREHQQLRFFGVVASLAAAASRSSSPLETAVGADELLFRPGRVDSRAAKATTEFNTLAGATAAIYLFQLLDLYLTNSGSTAAVPTTTAGVAIVPSADEGYRRSGADFQLVVSHRF